MDFKVLEENMEDVAPSVSTFIKRVFKKEEIENIFVSIIDKNYMDGVKLCEHYGIDKNMGINCLIVECKRKDISKLVALLVPTGFRYNMSTTVRKYTNSRVVSVAPLDLVLEKTGMEYGSIGPIGLPEDIEILIDSKVILPEKIICGSGLQKSKLMLPSEYFTKNF